MFKILKLFKPKKRAVPQPIKTIEPFFAVKRAVNGQFYWNYYNRQGQVVMSSEMYTRKDNALKGIVSVKNNTAIAGVVHDGKRYK